MVTGGSLMARTHASSQGAGHTRPQISAEQAMAIGFVHAEGRSAEDRLWKKPELEIVPYAPAEHQDAEAFAGPVGRGYGHRLVWVFGFQRGEDLQRWEVLVDAHSGEMLVFEDTNHYGEEQMVGGVRDRLENAERIVGHRAAGLEKKLGALLERTHGHHQELQV